MRRKAEAAAQRRRRRNRLIGFIFGLALLVAGTSLPLAVWALREREAAMRQEKNAVVAKNVAVQRSQDAEIAKAEAQKQKRDALGAKDDAERQKQVAEAAKAEAEKQKQNAVAANRGLQARNSELESLLEEAARSDRLVAKEKVKAGENAEALAHLARAIRYAPKSSFPAEAAIPVTLSPPIAHSQATLQGHGAAVTSVVFSPDGRRVLTASDDKTARLWEADSGQLLATFQGHTDRVTSAVFSPGRPARYCPLRWSARAGRPG